MKLYYDFISKNGSRKAQFAGITAIAVLAQPAHAWPLVAVCWAYIIGRAAHDVALELRRDNE